MAWPVIKPKGETTSNEILKAIRWLYNGYLKAIYPLRGIIEAFIAYVFPSKNRLVSQKESNAIKWLLLKAIAYNTTTIAEYIDIYRRRRYNKSLLEIVNEFTPKKDKNRHHTLSQTNQLTPTSTSSRSHLTRG